MNRNRMVVLNGIIVATTTILNAVLGMIEVSLFIKCYGSEINGLIQTGNQVLNYVVLIESGLSAAFLFKMYKPIADDDNKLLSEYYVGFRTSMGRVVNIMLCVAVASSAIYPFFIRKSTIPYLRMLAIFILLSLKVILPYRITIVPKYMIIAKEQKYKAEFISGITRGLTYISEIFVLCAIIFFGCHIPVEMVLLTGVIISLLDGMIFHFVMLKLYSSILDTNAEPNLTPNKMSKDILVHNLSRMVFSSTDNIIISTMGTLESVTIYSSYNMVVGQVIELTQKFMDGVTATLGIKIANEDENSYDIFREMLAGSYWLGGIISSVFVCMMNEFVSLWIGEKYCVNQVNLILFSMVLYCGVILPCIQVARNACGLYKESRNFTAAQAAVNLLITIALVPKLGIMGALIGTVFARIFITVPFNYRLVCNKVFSESKTKWGELLISYGLVIAVAFLNQQIISPVGMMIRNRIIRFIVKTIIVSIISLVIYTAYYYIIDSGFRNFTKRLLRIIKRR